MGNFDPAQTPSRASYKDRPSFLDYQARERTRLERVREQYQAILGLECAHGPRVRTVGLNGDQWQAWLSCPVGSPNCGVAAVPVSQVYAAWRDGQPACQNQAAERAAREQAISERIAERKAGQETAEPGGR